MARRRFANLVSLREDVHRSSAPLRVDREEKVIHGVKVLGLTSANGRRYTPEAIEQAAALYEGASVRADHPKKASDQREVDDVFGWLEGVEVREDGLYADLHYLDSHPLAERVCEAAERNPKLYGLSHNADGRGEVVSGTFVVHEITDVRSVDLVADPATTGGLFEGRERRVKLKAFFESIKGLKARQRKGLKALLEDGMGADYEMAEDDVPAADSDPTSMLKAGFKAACASVLDGEGDMKSKLAKLKELLKAEEKLLASGEATEEGDDDEDLEEGEDEEELEECDDDMKESKNLRRRLKARELCDEAGIIPSKALLEALVSVRSDATRKALIAEHKGQVGKNGRPRTAAPGGGSGGGKGGPLQLTEVKDGKTFASALREGRFSGN